MTEDRVDVTTPMTVLRGVEKLRLNVTPRERAA
jgi:hypothetical protein